MKKESKVDFKLDPPLTLAQRVCGSGKKSFMLKILTTLMKRYQ
jgi:hypothetical protein